MRLLVDGGLAMLGFVLLDGVWLGLVMNAFYKAQLAPIARMSNGALTPNWISVVAVYVLLGAGIALFALPRATQVSSAAVSGALLGLVVYGVYDLTNHAMLRDWPLTLVLVDIAWGAVASAAVAAAVWALTR